MCLIKGYICWWKNHDVIKMHGTTIKKSGLVEDSEAFQWSLDLVNCLSRSKLKCILGSLIGELKLHFCHKESLLSGSENRPRRFVTTLLFDQHWILCHSCINTIQCLACYLRTFFKYEYRSTLDLLRGAYHIFEHNSSFSKEKLLTVF